LKTKRKKIVAIVDGKEIDIKPMDLEKSNFTCIPRSTIPGTIEINHKIIDIWIDKEQYEAIYENK
jgi:hypothetical protein